MRLARRAAVLGLALALVVSGVVALVRLRGPGPIVPLTPERYVAVSLALKESLAECVERERVLQARLRDDPARLSKEIAEANAEHRARELGIFAAHRTTGRDFGDFLLIPANREATKALLAAKADLSKTLVSLEHRRGGPTNAAPGGAR